MEVVGGDITIELEVLGVASPLEPLDNPLLLFRREQSVATIATVEMRLSSQIQLQILAERLVVAHQHIVKQLIESPGHPFGFHLVEELAGSIGFEGRGIDGGAPFLLRSHFRACIPSQTGLPHRARRIEA